MFDQSEAIAASERYGTHSVLPAHLIVGLRGWDDFLVCNSKGLLFTIPTVPFDSKYLAPSALRIDESALRVDPRFAGKIKWYVKPIAFGGDPAADENTTWVNHQQHTELVRWWNDLYARMNSQSPP